MRSKSKNVPFSVIALGIATLLLNASSVIVFGLSAVYMKTVLGVHTGMIGFLEGFVEACAYLTKLFSGIISDYAKKRKAIIVIGFFMATIARPILVLFATFHAVFLARIFDRIGNGIQSTPRDALVGDLSPKDMKGRCYGLRQSLATAGSVLGGIIGFLAMRHSNDNFTLVFFIASIPAVLGLLVLIFLVKEPVHSEKTIIKDRNFSIKELSSLGSKFWCIMFVAFVFMLARVGEAMLILHAQNNFEMPLQYTTLILITYNASNSLASYPIGKISDRVSRYKILLLGFCFLVSADLVLAFATNIYFMFFGVVLWGMQIGITQSMFLALIADNVPENLRGTGFGFFYLLSAISLLVASTFGGTISHYYGEKIMFLLSSVIGVISICILMFFMASWKLKKKSLFPK